MSTRTLIVMRHAKSSWKTNEPDLRRPLSGRGTRDAVVAGGDLGRIGLEVVLLSPAVRAQQTWQCLTMGGASCGDVRTNDALYHAWTPEVLQVIRTVPSKAKRVLIIGHEPTMSDLVLSLAVKSPLKARIEEKFPTSAQAFLTHDGTWAELDFGLARLSAYKVPRG